VERSSLLSGLRDHRRRLVVVGVGPALVMAARDGRHVVVPLIADSFELSPSAIGALVAVGTGADLLLFPVAGYVMDRFGRLHAMVPAFSLMSVGLLLLGLADTKTTVVLATVVVGMGNGMSAGTLLTYGSDLAPRDDPGPFLAGLNVMSNVGRVIGPLIVGWSADAIGLGASAVALAVVLAAAVVWLSLVVGETGDRGTATVT
jgi:MFS family permease